MRTKRAGFTLIELLLVILILVVLSGIMLPVFARTRESARRAACISNLKQLITATFMYCDDYDGYLYPFDGRSSWTSKIMPWRNAYQPYVKNIQIFRCPSDKPYSDRTYNLPDGVFASFGASYFLNSGIFNYVQPLNTPKRLIKCKQPHDFIIIGDCAGHTDDSPKMLFGFYQRIDWTHNSAFADGHVKGVRDWPFTIRTNWLPNEVDHLWRSDKPSSYSYLY